MLQQATDWALRRLLKVLLKRNLKQVLATELDVEQLRVSLGQGSLELTDVLISPDWLAEQAPPGLEIVSGFIGRLVLNVAVTSLTCAVRLENVLVTVRPGVSRRLPPPPAEPPEAGANSSADHGDAGADQGGRGVDDGVRLVAAGVETLLQRMTVTLSRLTLRIEGSGDTGSPAASLSCTQLCCGAATLGADEQDSAAASTARHVAFTGLSLTLTPGGSDGGSGALLAPLGGEAEVTVSWPLDRLPGHQPHVSLCASLDAVQLQLRPQDVMGLLSLARGYAAAAAAAQQQQQQQQQPATAGSGALAALPPPLARQERQPGAGLRVARAAAVAGHRSFLEDLMLPGCPEALVHTALLESASSMGQDEDEIDEFFDASSALGSLQQAFSSAMVASYTSAAASPGCGSAWGLHSGAWGGGAAGGVPSGGSGGGDDDLDLFAMHDLAASIREAGGVQQKQWRAALSAPSLTLSLFYPEDAGGGSPHFAPRLVAEALELSLQADSGGSNGGSSSWSLGVGELEVGEHLAFPSTPSPASSAVLGGGTRLPAEEMARVPSVLPPAQHIRWPAPTSAGDYPLPDEANSLGGIGSTLAQLSHLSQATVYQSAAAGSLEGSVMMQSTCQGAAAVPRVQIVPVLRCGGAQGAALVALCTSLAAAAEQDESRQEQGTLVAGTDVALLVQPCSLWCTLPLLARLQSFAAPVAQQIAAAEPGPAIDIAAGAGAQQESDGGSGGGTLQQQQRQQQQQQQRQSGPLRLSLYLPAACAVVAVPGLAGLPGQPKYFAADVRGSSPQLLASMAPRLGSQAPKALVASLQNSGVAPTIVVQQGTGAAANCSWTCAVHASSVAVHGLAEADTPAGLGESMLGPGLTTALLASIEGESPRCSGGLSIDVQLRQPGPGPSGLMDSLWRAAGQDPAGGQPEFGAVREQLSAGAILLATVSTSSAVQLTLEPSALAAAGQLADGLLQLSAALPPVEAATQATVLLDCDVICTLRVPQGSPVCLAARSVRVAACASVGGVVGSSVVAVAVGSAELTRPGAGGSQLLVHVAGQQLGDGRRKPALQLLAPLRPTGGACMLCSNGRYVLPSQGRMSIMTAGLTLLLGESGQLDWAADLQGFAVPPSSSSLSSAAAAAAAFDAALPPPPPPTLDLAVGLSASAVRYEPRDASLAAAVLTAASITWQVAQGQQSSSVEARRLALHLAGPSGGSGGSGGSPAKGLQCGLASSTSPADIAGFYQVASEAGISIRLPAPQQQQQAGAALGSGSEGQGVQATQETAITNRGLNITLSRHTLLLLLTVAQQLSSSSGGGGGAQPEGGSLSGSGLLTPESSATSLSVPAAGVHGEGGREGGAAVNVMHGVMQSAYASPMWPAEHPLEVSVFLDGGWYDPEEQGGAGGPRYLMSPAGSPPSELEGFTDEARPEGGSRHAAAQEGQGVWYGGTAAEVQEEYVVLRAPSEEETAACFGAPGYDCRVLPPGHPPPLRRLSLRDIAITVTLADTFTTVLLPEDWGEDEEAAELRLAGGLDGPGLAHSGSSGAVVRRLAGEEEEEEEEVVPLSAQVQARLEGLCLQLDTFAAEAGHGDGQGDGCATLTRCALLLRNLEVRDSFQPRKGGGGGSSAAAAAAAASAAAATGWADLRRMLGYHASLHRVRAPNAAMVQLLAEGIRAEASAGDLEYRLQVQMLPLLLQLDQAALAFLQHFFAPAEACSDAAAQEGSRPGSRPDSRMSGSSRQTDASTSTAAGASAAAPTPGATPALGASSGASGLGLFFQRCEVQPCTLTINYRPRRVDLAALTSGQLAEVLNLVPWGGISLQFRHLRLFGMQGVGGVGTALASAYLEDIARFQAHRFVGGLAPIKSICRVSSAAAQLLAIPRQQLYKRASDGSGGLTLSALADEDFRRQMQRGLAGFVRAVALEACNLGATVAAGAEVALAGEASASHTVGVKQALRQASAHLRSSSAGPRTAASAAATAVRTTLLGVRNTLDREQTLERRLNS